MRRGVIDIGTNSVKLLIADLRGDEISPHLETSRQTRLGRGLYSGGKLQAEPIQATVAAVIELLALAMAIDWVKTVDNQGEPGAAGKVTAITEIMKSGKK